jgi:hypothetical protein
VGGRFRSPVRLKLTPEENAALNRRRDMLRDRPRVMNPDLYQDLLNAADLNESTWAWFRDASLNAYRTKLSEADFDRLSRLQLTGA